MKDGLAEAYEKICEKTDNSGVVGSTATKKAASGEGFDGDKKQAPGRGSANTDAKKPQKAPEKLQGIKEDKENEIMLPNSKFDELFKSQLVEEEMIDSEESPLERTGEEEFSDEQGDFPQDGAEDTTNEEVDVATELRMIIDRLTQVAERLGAYDEGAEGAGDMGEGEIGDEEAGLTPGSDDIPLTREAVVREGASAGGPGKGSADGKLKGFKNTAKQMQSKSFKVKSAFDVTSHKQGAAGGPGKGSHDGKLSPAKKTTLGPNMSMKADVKGTMGKPGAGLFD